MYALVTLSPPPPRFDSPLRAVSGTTKQLQHTKHLQRPAAAAAAAAAAPAAAADHPAAAAAAAAAYPTPRQQQPQQTTQRQQQQQQQTTRRLQSSSSSSSTSSRPPEARLAFVHPLWPQVLYTDIQPLCMTAMNLLGCSHRRCLLSQKNLIHFRIMS